MVRVRFGAADGVADDAAAGVGWGEAGGLDEDGAGVGH